MDDKTTEFNRWNVVKQKLHQSKGVAYAYPREVWRCSLGINIGAEIDGKNDQYERPVLVLKVYNKETLVILPITSRERQDRFHCKIKVCDRYVWTVLTQMRVISNRRLLRKFDVISTEEFSRVRGLLQNYI